MPYSIAYGGLSGYNVVGSVHTHQQGAAPVGGSFQLMFMGYGPSTPIPVDASAQVMRDALLTIPTINDVQVGGEGVPLWPCRLLPAA
jgi:hypothetical protein